MAGGASLAASRLAPTPDQIDFNNKAVLQGPLEPGQYVSLAFGQAARDAGIAVSMGSKGDCFDNAVAESFFATLKKELVHRHGWPTRRELAGEVFEYVEAFYNRQRRHSTLGYLSPADYENSTLSQPRAGLAASRLAHSPNKIEE
jgi:transposase InsO family protein